MDIGHVDVGNVDTVRTMMTAAIVNLARCKRNLGHMLGRINPAHVTRSPVDGPPDRRHPTPPNGNDEGPSSIVVRNPAPGFIRNPHIIAADPHPPACSIGSPSRGH